MNIAPDRSDHVADIHNHHVGHHYVKEAFDWLLFAISLMLAGVFVGDYLVLLFGPLLIGILLASAGMYRVRPTADGLVFEKR